MSTDTARSSPSATQPTVSAVTTQNRRRTISRIYVLIAQLGVGVAFLAAWEIAVRVGLIDAFIFGQPSQIIHFLFFEALPGKELWIDTFYTMIGTVMAFFFGSALGIAVGLLFVEFQILGEVASPYVTLLNSLPRVALAPLFVVWFGLGVTSKVVLGVSLVFFILLLNTVAGAMSADRSLIKLCQSLGASRWTIFQKVTLPSATPSIFAGLKLGLVYALLGVVVGEMIGAKHGLGMKVVLDLNLFEMSKVMGLLLFLASITTALSQLMNRIEKAFLIWRR